MTIPMPCSRNVAISVWFAVFAIATILAPNFVFSMFLLVLGLAGPALFYLLWHTPPVVVARVTPTTDTERRPATSNR